MNNSNRIRFEKPNLDQIRKQHTSVDLHFHSLYSDGQNSIPEIVVQAEELGIGIAITDHNQISGALEIDRYPDVLSIPGIEVTSCEGTHVLVYFYDSGDLQYFYESDIMPHMGAEIMSSIGLPMKEIVCRARAYDSVIIFPHPFCAAYTGICNPYFQEQTLQELFDMVDGVEVINAGNLKRWNMRSALLGFNLNKAITGGSDGHFIGHMGKAVTYAECPPDRASFLDAIRSGQNKVIGKEIALLRKVTSNGMRLRSNLKNYPDLVEKNIRFGFTVINNKSRHLRDIFLRTFNGRPAKKTPLSNLGL
jgi:predicted metal-dependent phosphoesterase TrpH